MEPNPNPLREQLLARIVPNQEKLTRYREEVEAMLAHQEKKLRWQAWYASTLWVFVVLLATAFLVLGAIRGDADHRAPADACRLWHSCAGTGRPRASRHVVHRDFLGPHVTGTKPFRN